MRVHLLDGTYELFRSFFGAPSAKGPDGREVGAVRAFARGLLRLVRTPGVTHVGAAFDTVIESFRNDLFAGYKTSEGVPATLLAQFPLAERATRALGVVAWSMVEFEADDALATAARFAAEDRAVERVLLCTPDKDLAQCVRGDRVVLWDRMRDKVYDEAGVVAKWGVPPASIPDWLALVGDAADGLPGLSGWGAKSAAGILQRFGRIEAIPDDPGDWKANVWNAGALAATLVRERDDVLLYKRLATLREDVPLRESVADLEWRGAHRAAVADLAREIGDASLEGLVPRWREDAPAGDAAPLAKVAKAAKPRRRAGGSDVPSRRRRP